ncbi:hypothetical protein QW131_14440 [Roseibium salinum]|nr:hypothetical protein [Roseibium salinum]
MSRPSSVSPINIAFAKARCAGIIIDFQYCAYYEVAGFDGFGDQELVIELPRQWNWRCPRCGGQDIECRPKYVSKKA